MKYILPEQQQNPDYYYESYKEFSWRFRLWVVAYGVSVPVIVLTKESNLDIISDSEFGVWAIGGCVIGVLLQVFLTWVYKTCMWYAHLNHIKEINTRSWRYVCSEKISKMYWMEAIVDFSTILLFSASTGILLWLVLFP
jgi:hypothetical protein